MSVLRRPGPRFAIEAAAIVLVAAIAGIAHLAWWEITLCVLAVLAVAFVVESRLAHAPAPQPQREPAPRAPELEYEAEPNVRVLAPVQAVAEPEAEPEPEPLAEPEPEPVAVATVAPALSAEGPWNVWELERALRDRGGNDEEQQFLLHYLRDYAGPDGTLLAEFDDLVRESFGSLLAS